MDIKYSPAHDSGRLHKNVLMSKVLPVILHHDMMVPTERRIKETVKEEEVKVNVNTGTITKKLLWLLITNNRHNAG